MACDEDWVGAAASEKWAGEMRRKNGPEKWRRVS
jgi:hypothetical protein